MSEKNRTSSRFPKKTILSFFAILVIVCIYLYYPIIECIREWGEYAEDCKDTFGLTSIISLPIFTIVWGIAFAISILVAKARQKR